MHSNLNPAFLLRQTNHPLNLVMWSLIAIAGGLYLFVRGFRLLQRRRLLLDTPFSRIRSAAMGMVEVSGLATGPYTMPAPITSHPCYYYRTVIWEYRQQGRNNRWVKIAAECKHLPFFLDDNTGRVLVDPRNAELDLHRDFQQQFCDGIFTFRQEAPENVQAFLMRHGITTRNKIKVEEFCIKPKNALFILGTLADNDDAVEITPAPVVEFEAVHPRTPGLLSLPSFSLTPEITFSTSIPLIKAVAAGSESAPTRIIQPTPPPGNQAQDPPQKQQVIDALLRAGITNPAAWQAAGLGSAQGGVTPSNGWSDAAGNQRPPVVLRKGANNPAFLISWQSRDAVAGTMFWKCMAMIWGGPALALAGLYLLTLMMGWS